MTNLETVRARFARNEGLPFADVLTEANILDVLNDQTFAIGSGRGMPSGSVAGSAAEIAGLPASFAVTTGFTVIS